MAKKSNYTLTIRIAGKEIKKKQKQDEATEANLTKYMMFPTSGFN